MSKDKLKHRKQFFDYEKELAYVSEMNRLGWKLDRVKLGLVYEFTKTEPEEYTTLIYAEKEEKLKDTEALAHRCGYETIPHKADGLKNMLYLTGRHSEVSPVFFIDNDTILRAQRMIFKRYFVMSIVCLIILFLLLIELALFFVIPAISSGKSMSEFPLFFGLTIGFSVLTLIFFIFTCVFIGSTLGVKKKIENLLKKKEEKAERKKRAAQRKIEPELIELAKSNEPDQRAVDMTKENPKDETDEEPSEESQEEPEDESGESDDKKE